MISRVLLGLPHQVCAVGGRYQKDYIEVEDNAVLIMRYPRAVGIAQASWNQIGAGRGSGPVIYGTAGTLIVHHRPSPREGHATRAGQVEVMTVDQPDGELLEVPDLPAEERGALAYFISRLERDAPVADIVGPEVGRDVQAILEAGYQSLASGRTVSLPLPIARPYGAHQGQ